MEGARERGGARGSLVIPRCVRRHPCLRQEFHSIGSVKTVVHRGERGASTTLFFAPWATEVFWKKLLWLPLLPGICNMIARCKTAISKWEKLCLRLRLEGCMKALSVHLCVFAKASRSLLPFQA